MGKFLPGFGPLAGLFLAFTAVLPGCATSFSPRPVAEVQFKARAQTQAQDGLTVTVAVPTADEAEEIYGVDLADKEMQAVWIQVKNGEDLPYWFLPSGLDPAYFSASEAAYAFRPPKSGKNSRAVLDHFESLQFRNPIHPGATASGFLVVNREEGYRAVDVDLVSREKAKSFTFIVLDPSFKGDFTLVDFDTLYDSGEIMEIEDEEALRRELEKLPCCTANKDGTGYGDPLNLVFVGNDEDIFPAYVRRGWHGTEILWSKAAWRTFKSFLVGGRYRYSPVSSLYVYGRRQDLAGQKARSNIHQRNHLRMWLSPLRFRGKKVWVGQISRDIGVKFTLKSRTLTTHVIDPDVDEARRYLIEDLVYSQALARIAFVKGVGEASEEAPRFNLGGDPYFSDGLRAVMFFEPRPRTLGDLDPIGDWEVPTRPSVGSEEGMVDTPRKPDPQYETALRARAKVVGEEGIRVSGTVPGPEESRAIFGVDLEKKGIEPLWLEIENDTDRLIFFLPTGLDPGYFSPREVSFGYHAWFSGDANAQLDKHIENLGFRKNIGPRSKESGFVYTNRDEASKFVSVDLVGRQWTKSLSLIVPTPDSKITEDHFERLFRMISRSGLVETDDESHLRELLEQMPCCVSSEDGTQGEPLNVVLVGNLEDAAPAFTRRRYRFAPADPRYFLQRPQDFSGRKREQWVAAQPHLFRAWLSTIRYRGKPVWVGQVSTPLGGRFARATEDGATPPIDPDVDEARNDLVQDLIYSQFLAKMGFVKGVGQVMESNPRKTPGGGTYHTDGLRAVLFFEKRPVHLSEIGFLEWERLVDHYRQQVGSEDALAPQVGPP
jgi:hypothetical protein